jgi:ankyrin repeat protein
MNGSEDDNHNTTHHPLVDAIHARDWKGAMKLLKIDSTYAQRGVILPLHLACEANAPINVIKSLIKAHPDAVRAKCGSRDRLPLHYHLASTTTSSCHCCPSESVISLLIESYPDSTRVGDINSELPIHLACQARSANISGNIFAMLLTSYPEGACARDINGYYPLDYATWNEDRVTKEIALNALVRNDDTEMRRSFNVDMGLLENPRLQCFSHDDSARTFKRKRLTKEVSFSIFDDVDDEFPLQ